MLRFKDKVHVRRYEVRGAPPMYGVYFTPGTAYRPHTLTFEWGTKGIMIEWAAC